MAITPFSVIQGHRFWYQSKPNMRLLLVFNLSCTVSKLWLIIGQIFASHRGRFTLTTRWGWLPANIAISDTAKTRFFGLHFTRRMYRWIFSNFYVWALKATEFGDITQNKATSPLKVIQSNRYLHQSKAHMRLLTYVIILQPFPIYGRGRLSVRFSLAIGRCFTLTPSLGVIPCEYPDILYLSRN